jgi:hypothetical protein
VSSEHSGEERSLREQVEHSERVLDNLESDLRAVDAELEALAGNHHQYAVLSSICSSLEELDELGVPQLFWGERSGIDDQVERLRHARGKIDAFGAEIVRVEERRESIVDKIGNQNNSLDYLHYDLQDLIEEEEARSSEWLLERETSELQNRAQVMPWARGAEEDQRLRRSLATSLAASFAIALLASVIALPLVERSEEIKLPERIAKLVRQERALPPPPPVQEPIIPDEELPEPEPELAEEQPSETLPESTEEPVLANVEQPDTREQVKSKGILAFRDSFASRADLRPNVELGSQARVRSAGEDSVGRPERMMVATSAPGSSGGINLSDISRDVGGGGGSMDGVALTRVASSIGGGDGPNRPLSGGVSAGRTDEEIQIVFDRYKAALYRLYNRELRKDPTLRGLLVLRLTIEPDGTVSLCQLYTSDMDAPMLAGQVVNRVLTFDFGAKQDIVAMTIIYPIDFLPAA